MAVLEYYAKHNMVAYLEKTDGNTDFHEIVRTFYKKLHCTSSNVSPVGQCHNLMFDLCWFNNEVRVKLQRKGQLNINPTSLLSPYPSADSNHETQLSYLPEPSPTIPVFHSWGYGREFIRGQSSSAIIPIREMEDGPPDH
ncbi:hypothetical protein Tco_0321747 [Tanacetum coccineum]